MRTYSDHLEYQGLASVYEKAKEILKSAQAEKKQVEDFFRTTKKEKTSTKTAVNLSHFQFRQAKLRQRMEKCATLIARLNLKEWVNSFEEQEKLAVKKNKTKVVQAKNGTGNHTDALEKPTSKAKSKSEKVKKSVNIVKSDKTVAVKDKANKKAKNGKAADAALKTPTPIVVVKSTVKTKQERMPKVNDVVKKGVSRSKTTTHDLTIIEGIGPKIAKILFDNDVKSFKALIAMPVETLKAWLKENKLPFIDPTTWAEQAQLVDTNKLTEFEALKKELKNGKRT
jgi:predicted flap endonuclease-1-like 5' DNA nuclease